MPRRGIHPVLNKMTYVFRNGASVELPSVMFSKKPIIMQVDPTSHPVWTGKERTIGDDDGRISHFSSKFEGFGSRPGSSSEDGDGEPVEPVKAVKQKKKKRS